MFSHTCYRRVQLILIYRITNKIILYYVLISWLVPKKREQTLKQVRFCASPLIQSHLPWSLPWPCSLQQNTWSNLAQLGGASRSTWVHFPSFNRWLWLKRIGLRTPDGSIPGYDCWPWITNCSWWLPCVSGQMDEHRNIHVHVGMWRVMYSKSPAVVGEVDTI